MPYSKIPEQFSGQEFAVGPEEYRSVIFAQDEGDLALMQEAAASSLGVRAERIADEAEAIEACRAQARELRTHAELQSDIYGEEASDVPTSPIYDERLAALAARGRLMAGQIAVRLAIEPVDDRYPTSGYFYQRLFSLRDEQRARTL